MRTLALGDGGVQVRGVVGGKVGMLWETECGGAIRPLGRWDRLR